MDHTTSLPNLDHTKPLNVRNEVSFWHVRWPFCSNQSYCTIVFELLIHIYLSFRYEKIQHHISIRAHEVKNWRDREMLASSHAWVSLIHSIVFQPLLLSPSWHHEARSSDCSFSRGVCSMLHRSVKYLTNVFKELHKLKFWNDIWKILRKISRTTCHDNEEQIWCITHK
jgi:hypothetical protein